MGRLFESFEFLNRGWDVRVLENQSLRSVFLCLLWLVFFIGLDTALATYQIFHLHRLDRSLVINMAYIACFSLCAHSLSAALTLDPHAWWRSGGPNT